MRGGTGWSTQGLREASPLADRPCVWQACAPGGVAPGGGGAGCGWVASRRGGAAEVSCRRIGSAEGSSGRRQKAGSSSFTGRRRRPRTPRPVEGALQALRRRGGLCRGVVAVALDAERRCSLHLHALAGVAGRWWCGRCALFPSLGRHRAGHRPRPGLLCRGRSWQESSLACLRVDARCLLGRSHCGSQGRQRRQEPPTALACQAARDTPAAISGMPPPLPTQRLSPEM